VKTSPVTKAKVKKIEKAQALTNQALTNNDEGKVKLNSSEGGGGSERTFGLTVRIEINLPSSGDQDTYDKIFKSIRENLING
jgi:hypothetical protein